MPDDITNAKDSLPKELLRQVVFEEDFYKIFPEEAPIKETETFSVNEVLSKFGKLDMTDFNKTYFSLSADIADIFCGAGYVNLQLTNDYNAKGRVLAHLGSATKEEATILRQAFKAEIKVNFACEAVIRSGHIQMEILDFDPTEDITSYRQHLDSLSKILPPRPEYPSFSPKRWRRIGVITNKETGDGYDDFISNFRGGKEFEFVPYFTSAMKTDKIIDGLSALRAERCDCIAIVRGGGTKYSLLDFQEPALCAAIIDCIMSGKPVLTGIANTKDHPNCCTYSVYDARTPAILAKDIKSMYWARHSEAQTLSKDEQIRILQEQVQALQEENDILRSKPGGFLNKLKFWK